MNQLDINPYLVTSNLLSWFSNKEHKTCIENLKTCTTELQKYKILCESLEKEVCANMEDEIKEKEKVYAFSVASREPAINKVRDFKTFYTERVKLLKEKLELLDGKLEQMKLSSIDPASLVAQKAVGDNSVQTCTNELDTCTTDLILKKRICEQLETELRQNIEQEIEVYTTNESYIRYHTDLSVWAIVDNWSTWYFNQIVTNLTTLVARVLPDEKPDAQGYDSEMRANVLKELINVSKKQINKDLTVAMILEKAKFVEAMPHETLPLSTNPSNEEAPRKKKKGSWEYDSQNDTMRRV